MIVYDGSDNIRLGVGANGYYLKADSTTASGLTWDSVAAGGVTNVTASSPIASSGGATPNISLTGIVPIANGGTGVTTLAGLVKGNGTSAFTSAISGTDYQAPITLTTTGTGALIVAGGVGITKSLNVGGSSNITNNLILLCKVIYIK